MALLFNVLLILFFHTTTYGSSWFSTPIVSYTFKHKSSAWIVVSSEEGFHMRMNDEKSTQEIRESILLIRIKGKEVFINDVPIPKGMVLLQPRNQTSCVEGKQWHGPLTLYNNEKSFVLRGRQQVYKEYQTVWQQEKREEPKPSSCKVRVLLEEKEISRKKSHTWEIHGDGGFVIFDPSDTSYRHTILENHIKVQYKRGHIYLEGKRLDREQIYILPKDGCAAVGTQWYHGSLIIHRTDVSCYLINHVDLEEYICGVLQTESWPGWSLEVNKVLAIACRSYAMAMIKKAKRGNKPYHLKNTNAHQTYTGMHNTLVYRQAVEQTRGMFIAYKGEPALAMFDCCCGGVIPAHIEGFNFDDAPYLARPYACTHCKNAKIFTWERKLTLRDMQDRLKKHTNGESCKDIQIKRKDKAGLVKELTVKGSKSTRSIPAKTFYQAVKNIKSYYFTVNCSKNHVTINGRGLGHQVGLCQWGAREMVEQGWPYKQVLQFYYPGTQVLRLNA